MLVCRLIVAPHAGAWIEISRQNADGIAYGMSLPMRERGLKYLLAEQRTQVRQVAPHAGAWIEMASTEKP